MPRKERKSAIHAVMSEREAEQRYQELLCSLRAEFPRFTLRPKRGDRLHLAIHRALLVLSLGRMRSYLTEFHTTLGQTVYVTDDWEQLPAVARWATLRHEAVHIRQFQTLGLPLMVLLYLLLPLPFLLSYGRMRLERAAYEETLRAYYEAGGEAAVRDPDLRRHVIRCFTSAAYLWMWPFPAAVAAWYDRFVDGLVAADRR